MHPIISLNLWLIIALAFEAAAVTCWSLTNATPWLGTTCHLLAILSIGAGLKCSGFRIRADTKYPVLLKFCAFSPTALPLFGPLLMGGLIWIWQRPSQRAQVSNFISVEEVYHGDEIRLRTARTSSKDSDILSIIRSSTPPERRRALLGVRSYEPAAAVPLLLRCLQDSDELVRIYAQGILQNLTEALETRSRTLRAKLERETSTKKRTQFEVELAEVFHEYVYSGLADEESMRRALLLQAKEAIERAVALSPQRLDIRFIQLRYLLQLRETAAGAEALELLTINNFDPYQLQPCRCELAFLQRDWQKLRLLCQEVSFNNSAYGRMLNACALWTPQTAR
ncbi:MAG: hypothetical protein ACI81V_000578 [Lentimonas sp.]|jgi:hypothetical protein